MDNLQFQQEDQEYSKLNHLLDKYNELSLKVNKRLDEINKKKNQQAKNS